MSNEMLIASISISGPDYPKERLRLACAVVNQQVKEE